MDKFLNTKKVIAFLIFCTLIIIAVIVSMKHNKKDMDQVTQTQYNSTDSINMAMSKLGKDDCGKAEIIQDIKTSENILALTFQGFADTETNQQILSLLRSYHRKASFFVPGIKAADDSETITAIYSDGHRIESNTLSELKHMEDYSNLDLVKDFCRTNDILKKLVDVAPEALLCNSTEYTPQLLKAAYVSGNQKVMKSTHYLNYQSFRNYQQALAYVKRLEKGSIITFKVKGTLDKEEYPLSVKKQIQLKQKT